MEKNFEVVFLDEAFDFLRSLQQKALRKNPFQYSESPG